VPAIAWVAVGSGVRTLQHNVVAWSDQRVRDLPGLSVSLPESQAPMPVYLSGQVTATSSATTNVLEGARITCTAPSGRTVYQRADRNHEGNDAPTPALRRLKVPVHFLYRPAEPGVHTCKLSIQAHNQEDDDLSLTVQAGPDTLLAFAMPKPRAVQFGTQKDRRDSDVLATCPGNVPCDAATHLGLNSLGQALPAGLDVEVNTSPVVVLSSSARGADLINDVSATVCYAGTTSCPAYATGGTAIRTAGTTVDARLVITQFDAHGAICAAQALGFQRIAITSAAHHQKLYLGSAYTFDPACGTSHRIQTFVELRWISGNPLRVDPEPYKTNGIVMESGGPILKPLAAAG
jgi:hypothetical protein